jgi:ABC-type nitrate/sulfonate/bicarbonate transport system ATPase subunit
MIARDKPTDSVVRGIEITDVSKVFGRRGPHDRLQAFRAIDSVSLRIEPHEFVSVIGPSGCGKTTLLRIVAGLVRPDAGQATVDGRRIDGPGHERAVVFQQPALLPWADVVGNVSFGLKLRGVAKAARVAKAQTLIDLVGLSGFERSLPRQLSGGMQQRVGLARALAVDPSYLLMDEPFGSLDEITRRVLQAELMRIWSQQEKGAMFITHSVDEAIILSDRVIVMSARPGRIVMDLKVNLERPRSHDEERSSEFLAIREAIWEAIGADDTGTQAVDQA